jgi:hypothetical protein
MAYEVALTRQVLLPYCEGDNQHVSLRSDLLVLRVQEFVTTRSGWYVDTVKSQIYRGLLNDQILIEPYTQNFKKRFLGKPCYRLTWKHEAGEAHQIIGEFYAERLARVPPGAVVLVTIDGMWGMYRVSPHTDEDALRRHTRKQDKKLLAMHRRRARFPSRYDLLGDWLGEDEPGV